MYVLALSLHTSCMHLCMMCATTPEATGSAGVGCQNDPGLHNMGLRAGRGSMVTVPPTPFACGSSRSGAADIAAGTGGPRAGSRPLLPRLMLAPFALWSCRCRHQLTLQVLVRDLMVHQQRALLAVVCADAALLCLTGQRLPCTPCRSLLLL